MSTKTNKPKYQNHLLHYRNRMQFTKEYVASLIGYKSGRTIARLESGWIFPSVPNLLKLSAILRVPAEFLYQDVYIEIREEIRKLEEKMPVGQQGTLPFPMQ